MTLKSIGASILRIATTVLLVVILFVFVLWWATINWYPLDAFAWHAKNGMSGRVGDYRVPISIWDRPDLEYGPNQFHMSLRPRRLSDVTFEVGRRVTLGSQWREGWTRQLESSDRRIAQAAKRFLRMTQRRIDIAGQPTICIEDSAEVSTIFCLPETQQRGLTANFFGSREEVPEFYELLSRVTKAK